MVALRNRAGGALSFAIPLGVGGGLLALLFTLIGYQQLFAQGAPADEGAPAEHVSTFKTPAERLGLTGKARARAESCLADAIYFESRGEPMRGQKAVAQVVMNRVFSGRYPRDVCGVVYQNSARYLACQFTFACTGKRLNRAAEPRMWQRAKRIAREMLDGKIWVTEVSHATHYHAFWVRPVWVREMAKLYRYGVHTFYRPRAWGDGSDAPVFVDLTASTKSAVASASKSAITAVKATGAESKKTEAAGNAEPKTAGNVDPKPAAVAEPKATGTTEVKPAASTEPKP
jgi:hypothetical protein